MLSVAVKPNAESSYTRFSYVEWYYECGYFECHYDECCRVIIDS